MEVSEIEKQEFFKLSIESGLIFNPHTPVSEKDLFSGRKAQIRRVLEIIGQRGLHAIIFGERGVGKTSLANVLEGFFPQGMQFSATRVNCDSSDTFGSVWKKIFDGMRLEGTVKGVGFNSGVKRKAYSADSFLNSDENMPEQVRTALVRISQAITPVVIIDEFDRLKISVRKIFADLIKGLSDHAVNVTIVLVGVGDSVDDLVKQHQSLSRNLVQIQMPRMAANEIEEIITRSLSRLDMTISGSTLSDIRILCRGLPHYAHLLGLNATKAALERFSKHITESDFRKAVERAVNDSNHSILTTYLNAIRSTKVDSLFADVLLACAKAEVNELGEFAAKDLIKPLKLITDKTYNIPSYAQHLNEFSESKRGNLLIKSGETKRYRYKFRDPLMQPFIIMQGILQGKIILSSPLPPQ